MRNLTAFLIVRNEEEMLPRCLASLSGTVDGIVILDTGSQDGTRSFLERASEDPELPPVTWYDHPFQDFGHARQAALDRVTTEWALWIDADEVLTPALAQRIRQITVDEDVTTCDAYRILLVNRVYGRVMRGRNLSGQYRLRLFRKSLVRFSRSVVHEGLDLRPDSRTGQIEEPLLHDTLTSWRRYLQKVDLYTDLESASLPARSRTYLLSHMLVTLPATMWREYIWRRGFRDGWSGLVWAVTTAWSSLLRDWKMLRRGS